MNKNTPRYITVYHEIKNGILSGQYPENSFLPTEGELEKIYGTSRTTIRSAIALLRDEHLVRVQQGRGTEVLPKKTNPDTYRFPSIKSSSKISNQFVIQGDCSVTTQGAMIDRVPAELKIAAALGLEPGTEVYRLQRDKYVNNTIFCYTVSYVPCHLAPDLEKYNGEIMFLYQFLKETYGIEYTTSKIHISAITAGFIETRLLNVQRGAPLLQHIRVASSPDGPFEYNESLFRPDIIQLVVDMTVDMPDLME